MQPKMQLACSYVSSWKLFFQCMSTLAFKENYGQLTLKVLGVMNVRVFQKDYYLDWYKILNIEIFEHFVFNWFVFTFDTMGGLNFWYYAYFLNYEQNINFAMWQFLTLVCSLEWYWETNPYVLLFVLTRYFHSFKYFFRTKN